MKANSSLHYTVSRPDECPWSLGYAIGCWSPLAPLQLEWELWDTAPEVRLLV